MSKTREGKQEDNVPQGLHIYTYNGQNETLRMLAENVQGYKGNGVMPNF
jgi:hypothetical protein